jgi:AraC-like DNA-binding protein
MYKEESFKTYEIKNGCALFRSAYYEHSNQFSNQQGICLNVEVENPEEIMNHNEIQFPSFEFKPKGSSDIYRLLYAFQNDVPKDLLEIYCYESFSSYFSGKNKGKQEWIDQVKDSINDNPVSNLSLHKLSSEFQLHPNYIIRKFKEVTGYKLSEYLMKIRLENSIQALINNRGKLTEIALNNGFYDQSHFIKNFRKYLNVTPTKFRNSVKKLV